MRAFVAFLKKEFLEAFRSGRLLILGVLFICFGIMNPAIAKLTPWMLEIMSEELADSGMTVTAVTVDAITSWVQFFKNIPMALIVFVIMHSSSFTREYTSGTLTLIVTKGLARYKILLAKAAVMLLLWTAGYFLCFGVTYAYNAYFWDNSIAIGLVPAVLCWWIFGVWVICLLTLFSIIFDSSSAVLVATGGVAVISYIWSLIPHVGDYSPAVLMSVSVPYGGDWDAFIKSGCVTLVMAVGFTVAAVPLLNKKSL